MLRVTLELLPFGDERVRRRIGRIDIENVSGGEHVADYLCDFEGASVTVQGHRRADGAWELVRKCLEMVRR